MVQGTESLSEYQQRDAKRPRYIRSSPVSSGVARVAARPHQLVWERGTNFFRMKRGLADADGLGTGATVSPEWELQGSDELFWELPAIAGEEHVWFLQYVDDGVSVAPIGAVAVYDQAWRDAHATVRREVKQRYEVTMWVNEVTGEAIRAVAYDGEMYRVPMVTQEAGSRAVVVARARCVADGEWEVTHQNPEWVITFLSDPTYTVRETVIVLDNPPLPEFVMPSSP